MAHLLLAVIYIAFISLGLPDSLLGAGWPTMYPQFGVPMSYAGIISAIISVGTIISSLLSDRLTHRFGAGKVTAVSVAMTAVALLGFSTSGQFWMLLLWAIPYGLGAGGVDAALNNYVAVHYASHHMSWLHCFWGVGASISPYIMGYYLAAGQPWNLGYRSVGLTQLVLCVGLFFTLSIWKGAKKSTAGQDTPSTPLSLGQVFRLKGAKEIFLAFFCYCAIEQTTALWASSYLVLHKNVPSETAAFFASLFFIGITAGRALNGFLTMKFSDTQLIRAGQGVIALGILAMFLPLGQAPALVGLILIGLGCAPVYPCIVHSTPAHFGAENSQAVVGVQMASAYVGTCLMPPLFGLIANHINVSLLPVFLLAILALMIFMHEGLLKKAAH